MGQGLNCIARNMNSKPQLTTEVYICSYGCSQSRNARKEKTLSDTKHTQQRETFRPIQTNLKNVAWTWTPLITPHMQQKSCGRYNSGRSWIHPLSASQWRVSALTAMNRSGPVAPQLGEGPELQGFEGAHSSAVGWGHRQRNDLGAPSRRCFPA